MYLCNRHLRFSCHHRKVVCKATQYDDRKPVFQFHPNGAPVSFNDMKEAYNLLSDFPKEHRLDCYASLFNINGEAMSKYYGTVALMEKMYQQAVDNDRKNKSFYFKLGPFHIYIST